MAYDKHGTPIIRGDIVKVFHFIGSRRKRHYMYKQCLGEQLLHESHPEPYVLFSHLNFIEDRTQRDGPYSIRRGERLDDYEIVQSIKCDHEDRKKVVR
jgi:hypothetical protein